MRRFFVSMSVNNFLNGYKIANHGRISKELGSYRALVKVRKSCVQMTLPMIQIGPKLHQMTSELWDSINAIQNPYSLVR